MNKRIYLLIASLRSGGAERQLTELAIGLKQRGYEPTVVTYREGDHYRHLLQQYNIEMKHIPKKGTIDVAFVAQLAKTIKRGNPYYLISYLTEPNIWTMISGFLSGQRNIIISERNTDMRESTKIKYIQRALVYMSCKKVVSNSRTATTMLGEELGYPKSKLTTIYNGINTEALSALSIERYRTYMEEHHIQQQTYNIGLVGRISAQKNHLLLIQAMAKLVHERNERNIACYFIGAATEDLVYQRVQQAITEYKLEKHIFFLKPTKEIQYFYNAMNCTVLPSLFEGFPNVVLESMGAGTLVVASNVSDNASIIEHGVDGYIFESENVEQLTHTLQTAMQLQQAEKENMEQRAFHKIHAYYSNEQMVTNYIDLLHSC